MNATEETALGAVVGALVGDAAGAVLEFHRGLTTSDVKRAMTMRGGGAHKVAPGQITDDGELTLCLLQAMCEAGSFDDNVVGDWYGKWMRSHPFDIGGTCRASLGKGFGMGTNAAFLMRKAASQHSMSSAANGALMRQSPLGVFCHRLKNVGDIANVAIQDTTLSHPNELCQHTSVVYCIALSHLVGHPGDRAGAIQKATAWASQNAAVEVNLWLANAQKGAPDLECSKASGFVKHAFTLTFKHLCLGSGYVEALEDTLSQSGDTDTNACIVGGMIGAAVGVSQIPQHMRNAVLLQNGCKRKGGPSRPAFLIPGIAPDLVRKLVAIAPESISPLS